MGYDDSEEFKKAEEVILRVAIRSDKEKETQEAHIAGRLDAFNGLQFLILLLITFCLYICFRKKKIGGFIVTSRRVISVSVIQDATGQQIEYEQANYFIRHFAYERHFYDQPTYTCWDYVTCQPCVNCLMCTPLTPRVGIQFKFVAYPVENVFQEGNIGTVCVACCAGACRSCTDTCLQSCCGGGFWGYEGGTVYVEMKVDYVTGLRRVNNVVAAVLFYHPAKDTNFGREWDPQDPYPHPRLLATSTKDEDRDYNAWDKEQKVPIERLASAEDVGTWGIVLGEKILDGYAPKIVFCTCYVLVCSIVTLGIGYCILRCQYDHCVPIERVYYVLTDRRLIRYTLKTTGAKTVPKLHGDEDGKTEFEMEISSWIMANIHTFRYSEARPCWACCGECLCCKKRTYGVTLHTPFGMVALADEGKDSMEAFLKSLMNQHYEAPLRGITNHMRLGQDQSALRPDEDDDVVYIKAPEGEAPNKAEQPLARIKGEVWGGIMWMLQCICMRIGTCCCFPRDLSSNLYITDMRVITSATAKVPCLGKTMDTYTEYYTLAQVRRVRAAERFKCSCCGCIHCCPSQVFAISTDNDFEYSMEGEEVYTINEVYGVEGGDANEQMQNITAAFALMNTHEGWLNKKVMDAGRWSEFVQPDFRLEGQSV